MSDLSDFCPCVLCNEPNGLDDLDAIQLDKLCQAHREEVFDLMAADGTKLGPLVVDDPRCADELTGCADDQRFGRADVAYAKKLLGRDPPILARAPESEYKTGAQLIVDERMRQIAEEGMSHAHDDKYKNQELLRGACTYMSLHLALSGFAWPWAKDWWKPSGDPVRNLTKAGALIAAEIDRIQRARTK